MDETGPCPDPQQLRKYVSGSLDPEVTEQLNTHLRDCSVCAETLNGLKADDTETVHKADGDQSHGLSADSQPGDFVVDATPPPVEYVAPPEALSSLMDQANLGPYRIEQQIGRGGMGSVYRAVHIKLDKPVALKVIPGGQLQSPEVVERFAREMKAVGKLDHPNLVRATDAGEEHGVHYLVMDLVEGADLGLLSKRLGPLPVPDACEIVRQAALGLQYVHEQGLVHRDVKPTNFMLTHDGTVKVLDLGLALLADAAEGQLTDLGGAMGTVDYMAPEQADDSHLVDRRADLYSLGCTLYQLLCGQAPFSRLEYGTRIKRLMAHAQSPPQPIQERRSDVPEEAARLIERMLSKVPADRPQSAAEVAEVLAPFAQGADPSALIRAADEAGRDSGFVSSTSNRAAQKLYSTAPAPTRNDPQAEHDAQVPRRGWPLAAGILAVLVLVTCGVIIIIRDKQGNEVARLNAKTGDSVEVVVVGEPARESLPTRKKGATPAAKTLPMPTGIIGEVHSLDHLQREDISSQELAVAGGGDPRNAPKELVSVIGDSRLTHEGRIGSLDLIADRNWLVTGGDDESVRVWDAATGNEVLPPQRLQSRVRSVAASQDGKHIACASGNWEMPAVIQVWEIPSGIQIFRIRGDDDVPFYDVAFSPDGKKLVGVSKELAIWNVTTGQKLLSVPGDTYLRCVAFSPDGKQVAAGDGKLVQVWDTSDGSKALTLAGHGMNVSDVAYHPDGNHLVSIAGGFGSAKGELKVWDASSGAITHTTSGSMNQFNGPGSIAFSPDGALIACSCSQFLTLLNTTTWTEAMEPIPLNHGFPAIFGPNGKRVASVIGWTSIGIWDVATGQQLLSGTGPTSVLRLAFRPDGKRLTVAGAQRPGARGLRLELWDARTQRSALSIDAFMARNSNIALSSDGQRVAAIRFEQRKITVWDAPSARELLAIDWTDERRTQLALSPTGQQLISALPDGTMRSWQIPSGEELLGWKGHSARIDAMEFSADGRLFASGSQDRTIRIWDALTGKQIRELWAQGPVHRLAFSPDRQKLASAANIAAEEPEESHTIEVKIWDVNSGDTIWSVDEPDGVRDLAFSPNGNMLASAGQDRWVRLRDAASGATLHEWQLQWHAKLAFAPDGRHLATGNGNGTVYILRIPPSSTLAAAAPPSQGTSTQSVRTSPAEDDIIDGLGTWLPGPDDNVLPGLAPRPAKLPGIKRWNVETIIPRSWVTCLAYSPDGNSLAYGTGTQVRIVDAESKRLTHVFDLGRSTGARQISWSSDGRTLASASSGRSMYQLWNVDENRPGPVVQGDRGRSTRVPSVCFDPVGPQIVGGQENDVVIWSAEDGRMITRLKGHEGPLRAVAWSPNGKLIASGGEDKVVRIWNATNNSSIHVFQGHSRSVNAISWHPDGQRLVSCSDDGQVRLWSLAAEEPAVNLPKDFNHTLITDVVWSPDGEHVAAYVDHFATVIWDANGNQVRTIPLHDDWAKRIAWTPDSQHVVACTLGGIRRWQISDGSLVEQFGGAMELWAVKWSPDGRWIAAGGNDELIRVFEKSGRSAAVCGGHNGPVRDLAWSAEARFLASAGSDKSVRIWETDKWKQHRLLSGHLDSVTAVAWNPHHAQLASGSPDRTIRLWNLEDGDAVRVIQSRQISDLAWSRDGRRLASAERGSARIWQIAQPRPPMVLNTGRKTNVVAVAWSPSGDQLITKSIESGSGKMRWWNSETGQPGLVVDTGYPTTMQRLLAWNPGNPWIVSDYGYQAELIDSRTGRRGVPVFHQRFNNPQPLDADWDPRGRYLAAGGRENTVQIWDTVNNTTVWIAVLLPAGQSVSITPAGELIHGDVETENQLVYYVEREDGPIELFSPADFRKRFADNK